MFNKDVLISIRKWFLLGLLLLLPSLLAGCSNEEFYIIKSNSTTIINSTTVINGSVVGATAPYLYMVGNNVTQNETKLLSIFLTSESDPVFLGNNVSIWSGINSKVSKSGDTMTGDLVILGNLSVYNFSKFYSNVTVNTLIVDWNSSSSILTSEVGYDIDLPNIVSSGNLTLLEGGAITVGTHYYYVTFYTAIGETTAYTIGNKVINSTHALVNITNIPLSNDTRIIGRKLYRGTAGATSDRGSPLVTIADMTTTSYLDNKTDAQLGTTSWVFYRPNTAGKQITIDGTKAMLLDSHVTAIGYRSGGAITEAPFNTFVGVDSGASVTTSQGNVFVGESAGRFTTTGGGNIAIGGYLALYVNTIGQNNIVMGGQSARNLVNGSYNTGIGNHAFWNLKDGSYNVALGDTAGRGINESSSYNTFLGYGAGNLNQLGKVTNSMALGYLAFANASNQVVIGNPAVNNTILRGHVDMNYTHVANNLTVDGAIFAEGRQGITGNYTMLKNESLTIDFIAMSFILTPTYCVLSYQDGILFNSTC